MEYLGNIDILRYGLMKKQVYPKLASQIGVYLARELFFTSDFGLNPGAKKALVAAFMNPELCAITERLVFTEPYIDSQSNDISEITLPFVKKIWEYDRIKVEIDDLRKTFMNSPEALIHGDLHTGSIFVTNKNCKIFDSEFAFYGPIAYDIGLFFANILIDMLYWKFRDLTNLNSEYEEYQLSVIGNTWNTFSSEFLGLFKSSLTGYMLSKQHFVDKYLNKVLCQSIGFCACEMLS